MRKKERERGIEKKRERQRRIGLRRRQGQDPPRTSLASNAVRKVYDLHKSTETSFICAQSETPCPYMKRYVLCVSSILTIQSHEEFRREFEGARGLFTIKSDIYELKRRAAASELRPSMRHPRTRFGKP